MYLIFKSTHVEGRVRERGERGGILRIPVYSPVVQWPGLSQPEAWSPELLLVLPPEHQGLGCCLLLPQVRGLEAEVK